jgi:hypothetical protein
MVWVVCVCACGFSETPITMQQRAQLKPHVTRHEHGLCSHISVQVRRGEGNEHTSAHSTATTTTVDGNTISRVLSANFEKSHFWITFWMILMCF